MKTIKLLFCFSLFFFSFSLCEGQSWIWAKAGVNNSNAGLVDPFSMVIDANGNNVETGEFTGNITFGAYTLSTLAGDDFFITKYDPNGNVLWADSANVKSNSLAFGGGVTTDKIGNYYATGYFFDSISFAANALTTRGQDDVFLVKYNSNGNVVWAKSGNVFGTSNLSMGYAVKTDSKGNVYVAGLFHDSVSFGPYLLVTSTTQYDAFLVKYDSSGNVLWAKSASEYGNNRSEPYAMDIDKNDNIYVTGLFSDYATFGSFFLSTVYADVFLVKYDTAGNVIWAKEATLPTYNSQSESYSTMTDDYGNVYVTGNFIDTVFFGPYLLGTKSTTGDVFLVKYDKSGNVIWAKCGIAPNTNIPVTGWSLAKDNKQHIFLAGTFQDTITFGALQITSKPGATEPSFLLELDTAGNSLCGTSIDNINDDCNLITADPYGNNVYFAGDAEISPCTFGAYTLNGKSEWAFWAKWRVCDSTETDGVNEVAPKDFSIKVYPNPNNGVFTIHSSEVNVQASVEIYNVLGKKVYYVILKQIQGDNTIDISNQPAGVYYYRIIREGAVLKTGKIVLQ